MAELRTLQGHALLLPEGSVTVGSDPENEIPIASHLGLAAHHFRLQPWQGGHFLEDTGSGLGTLVNGHPVSWKPLLNGDIITAGDLQLAYSQNHPAAHRTTPTALAPAPGIAPPLSFPSPANPVPGGFPGSLSFPEPAAPSSPA
ncbi:MAG: Inner rane component of cytoplasmic domain, partial [Verrucomicrobiales bacterium]|nr:Inner rane component of cytoplasmic domain [Verrucomicrobiales bacterium]